MIPEVGKKGKLGEKAAFVNWAGGIFAIAKGNKA
jgi:hypothetical protein